MRVKGTVKKPDLSTAAKRKAYKEKAVKRLGKAKADAHMKELRASTKKKTPKKKSSSIVKGKQRGYA